MTSTLSPATDLTWTDELGAERAYQHGFIGPTLPGCAAWGVNYFADEWIEQAAQLLTVAQQFHLDGYPATARKYEAEAHQLRSCAHRLIYAALAS